MQIIRTKIYLSSLFDILEYIAKDNKQASYDFVKNLDIVIKNLTMFPQMYKQSVYYNDDNYRDLTYKGYTIIYKITQNIEIIDIFNQNKPLNSNDRL